MDKTKTTEKPTDIALREGKEIYDPTKPFNDQIRELIRSAHPEEGPMITVPYGKRFMIERNYAYWNNFYEMNCTDSIGTKGLLHWSMGSEAYGVHDVFAMVVDDLIEGGFVPVVFQDEIEMQEERQDMIFNIVSEFTKLAIENSWKADGSSYPIIISGGETAIINTLRGFNISMTATGYVRKGHEIHANIKDGDLIIGLGSNGIHSNGLSFYRQELFDRRHLLMETNLPWGVAIGEELTRPTYVYLPAVKALIESAEQGEAIAGELIHGMVHITGGGMSKLKELIPEKKDLDIDVRNDHDLRPQEIFQYAHDELGMPSDQMYVKFNNGVGYVIAVEESFAPEALETLRNYFAADIIGQVKAGTGKVLIASQYASETVEYSK